LRQELGGRRVAGEQQRRIAGREPYQRKRQDDDDEDERNAEREPSEDQDSKSANHQDLFSPTPSSRSPRDLRRHSHQPPAATTAAPAAANAAVCPLRAGAAAASPAAAVAAGKVTRAKLSLLASAELKAPPITVARNAPTPA